MHHEQQYGLLALDIDQTLAGGVVATHLTHYNEQLKLGLTREEIATAGITYKQTFDVPAIQAYRQQDEKRFQEVRSWIRTSHAVHTELSPIVHSRMGVLFLSNLIRNMGYYTVRPTEVTQATHEWLSTHDYPYSDHVVISKNYDEKLTQVLTAIEGSNERALLVDDSLEPLLAAAARLCTSTPELFPLFSQLTIVGFNHTNTSIRQSQEQHPEHMVGVVEYLRDWSATAVRALAKRLNIS